MHRMCGLNLAWHWHVVCVHVHLRRQSENVEVAWIDQCEEPVFLLAL